VLLGVGLFRVRHVRETRATGATRTRKSRSNVLTYPACGCRKGVTLQYVCWVDGVRSSGLSITPVWCCRDASWDQIAVLLASILGKMPFINTFHVCSLWAKGILSGHLSGLVRGAQPQGLLGLCLLSRHVEYGGIDLSRGKWPARWPASDPRKVHENRSCCCQCQK
jgi:hypothetical protein